MVNLRTFDDQREFLRTAQPFLERDEVLNSLILGVNIRVVEHPDWQEGLTFQAVVEDARGEVILVVSISPGSNLLVAGAPDAPHAAFDHLAEHLFDGKRKFPGVNGEQELSRRTAAAWSNLTGQPYFVRMRLRAYELRQVIPPPARAPGRLRQAVIDDLDLVFSWREAFGRESLHAVPPPGFRQNTRQMLEAGSIYIWENAAPVSMAARTRPTPHGVSIGAVYTPPEERGRGYASACVAELSQRMLDGGKQFCALFTDLDNPTSNAIYQKIGYRMVGDFMECSFETR